MSGDPEHTFRDIETLCEMDAVVRADDACLCPPDPDESSYVIRNHDLTEGREYEVLAIEGDDYRLLNDGQWSPNGPMPALFNNRLFAITKPDHPKFWVKEYGDDGELYASLPDWGVGFFEDFFDGDPDVKARFREDIATYFPWTNEKMKRDLS